jgi:predicted amidohydrolase YtcJ
MIVKVFKLEQAHSAMDIFRKLWPPDTVTSQMMESGLVDTQAKFAAAGITTFGDVNTRGLDTVKAYSDFARSGKSIIRGYIMNTIEYPKEVEGRIEKLKPILYENDYLQFKGFKFLVDGAGGATYMHEPHTVS